MDDRDDALDFIYKSFREGRQQRRNLAMERGNRQRRAFQNLYTGDLQNVVSQPTSMPNPPPTQTTEPTEAPRERRRPVRRTMPNPTPTPEPSPKPTATTPPRRRPVRRKQPPQEQTPVPAQDITSSPPEQRQPMSPEIAARRLGVNTPLPSKNVEPPKHDYATQGFPTRDENTRPDLGPVPEAPIPKAPIDDSKGNRRNIGEEKDYDRYKLHQRQVGNKLYDEFKAGNISQEQAQQVYNETDAQNRPKRIEPKTPSVGRANEMLGDGSLQPNKKEAPVETPIPKNEVREAPKPKKDDVAQEMIENEKNHKTAFEGAMNEIQAPEPEPPKPEPPKPQKEPPKPQPKKTAKEVVEETKETPKPKEDKKVKNVVASLPKKKGIEFKETSEGEDPKARDIYVPGKGYVSQSKYTQLKRDGYTPKKRRGDDGVERTYMMPPKGAKASEKGKAKVKEVADNMAKPKKKKTEKKQEIKPDPKVKEVASKAIPKAKTSKTKPKKNTGNKATESKKKFKRKDEEREGAFTGGASESGPKKKVDDNNKVRGMDEVGDKEPVALKMLAKAMTARDLRMIEELLSNGVSNDVASVGLDERGYFSGSISVNPEHTQALMMNIDPDMISFARGLNNIKREQLPKFPLDKVRMPTAKQPPSYERYKNADPLFDVTPDTHRDSISRKDELMRAWRRGLNATAPNTKADLMEMLGSGEVTIDGKVIDSPGSASRAYANLPPPSKRNLKYPKNEIFMGMPFYSSKGKDFVLPIYNNKQDAIWNAHYPFAYRRFDPLPQSTPAMMGGQVIPQLESMEEIVSLLPKNLMRRIKDAEEGEGVGMGADNQSLFNIAGSGFDAKTIKNIANRMSKTNPDDFLRFGIGGTDNNILSIAGRTPDKMNFTHLSAFSHPTDKEKWSSINDLLE